MKDKVLLVGLDFETSAGDVDIGAPIQIGITVGDQNFVSDIGGWKFDDSTKFRWSEKAAKVHNITQERLNKAPDIFEVDIFATAWLLPLIQGYQRMNVIAVGWNVGSFDRQLVYRNMPNLNKILSYRTLDLNTVCFFTAKVLGDSFEKIKKQSKQYSEASLTEAAAWHDALYDAKAGMYQLEYLTNFVKDGVWNMIKQSVPAPV